MQLSSALICLLLGILPSLSYTSPIAIPRQAAAPTQFMLQTQVYAGIDDCGTNKDGLNVFSYHTGAGLGVAAAAFNITNSFFYLNDTTLQWTYPDNEIGPWPVTLENGAYRAFNEISISIAEGPATSGFYVDGTGLHQNTTGGWMACDWSLDNPLIMALSDYASPNMSLPTSCSMVNLIPIPYTQN